MLRIDAPELAGLPWEAMYDQGAGGYVCRHHQLVHPVLVAAVPPPLEARLLLRVLGVISASRGLAPLDAGRERQQLERALTGPAGQGLAEVPGRRRRGRAARDAAGRVVARAALHRARRFRPGQG